MSHNLSPPAPFPDFENFTFDPSLFPNPPPLPASADLFSPDEALDLQAFLDNFGAGLDWDLPPATDFSSLAPYSNPHLHTAPEPSAVHHTTRPAVSRAAIHAPNGRSSSASPPDDADDTDKPAPAPARGGSKPLLSTPQKRLNHIMSEQKRRNAIRDGYAQLIALLAPAGATHGIGMPTRGRPKGSGMRGKGQTKGKSGVLFRAVEYCQWLEDGRDALRAETPNLPPDQDAGPFLAMAPIPPEWPIPKLTLRIDDLTHPGTRIFLAAVTPLSALRDACVASFAALYTPHSVPRNVQTLTLILRSIPGAVAHTTGNTHHKEIHYSLEYIYHTRARATDEIRGVLTHEAVHCFQHDAAGSCNAGLIEGVADYVRHRAGLAPPHWPQPPAPSRRWDAGYETTAYFLVWLDAPPQYGPGFVQRLNARLETGPYRDAVFEELTGCSVDALWGAYCAALQRARGGGGGGGGGEEEKEKEEREEEEGDDAMWEVVEVGEGVMPLDTKTERSLSVGALFGWGNRS
ncbi:hypothetical protein H0H87_008334 [Tephrocybe sp. NHM501043]|nr:hypothetical protein H0H87_008334 [Tephrocybe sp. NHM501043]